MIKMPYLLESQKRSFSRTNIDKMVIILDINRFTEGLSPSSSVCGVLVTGLVNRVPFP